MTDVVDRLLGRGRTWFLRMLPPRIVRPFVRVSLRGYSDTPGDIVELVRERPSGGMALVITRVKPRFLSVSENGAQMSTIANEYLMYTGTPAIGSVFEIAVDNGAVADLATSVDDGAGGVAGAGGMSVQIATDDLLGWKAGTWLAYVRPGGVFTVRNRILASLAAGTNTVPDVVGVEVGGFYYPDTALTDVVGPQ